ncbi:hypothetical protein ACFSFY_05475 [Sporosarcina siberiensis]|uniref:Transporter n=1 Tax=Sporosarcina siberiensis TaxID=1365606 RepID=A0ABW4SEX9_9BACL
MVNMPPDNQNERQWYPQLPEGYNVEPMSNQYQSNPGMPGYGSPMGQQFEQGMPGYGPQMGQQFGQGMPGYGPPMGHQFGPGMPGFGPPPGAGMPGFRPPMNFPPGAHGMPNFDPHHGSSSGQHGQQGQQGPSSPPPNFAPPYPGGSGNQAQVFAVDPGAIRGCLYRQTYVWLSRRQGFWFYPTYVGRTSVAGYRWRSRRRRWEYFGIDLNQIDSFTCF